MTDKKILTAIKSKINELVVKNKKYKAFEDIPEKRHQLIIEGQLLGELKHFIDSLQEEPNKCMFTQDHYTEEDRKVFCEDCDEDCEYAKNVEPVSEEECNITGIRSVNAKGKLKEMLDNIDEESVARTRKQMEEEHLEAEIIRYIGYPQEVDEDVSTTMIRKAARRFANWQKQQDNETIKDRIQPVQEWNGGDDAHLHSIITHLQDFIESHPNTTGADIQGENVAWLKSLKERYTWKPSEEQMKALWDSIPEDVKEISEREMLLNELYKDLKKL